MSQLNVDTIGSQTGSTISIADGHTLVGGGKIQQVVQGTLTSTTSSINEMASPVDMGLSANITPSSASNKVLVLVNIGYLSWNSQTTWGIQLVRGSTLIGIGDASSTRIRVHAGGGSTDLNTWQGHSLSGMWLDSPSTTSETTYKVQYGGNGGARIYINRSERDHTNSGDEDLRAVSTITLMEVSA